LLDVGTFHFDSLLVHVGLFIPVETAASTRNNIPVTWLQLPSKPAVHVQNALTILPRVIFFDCRTNRIRRPLGGCDFGFEKTKVTFSVVRVVESFLQKIASKVPYSHTTTDVINLLANLFPQGILQYRGSRWVAISSKPIPRFPIPSLLQWGHHVMFRRRGRNNRPRDSAAASLCN